MKLNIIFYLCLFFALTNSQCPSGYQYASPEYESFSLPQSGKYYQVAFVCTDYGSFTTGIFKRESSQKVDCNYFGYGGHFADPCNRDENKVCCVSQTEYDTSIAGFDGSKEIAKQDGQFSISKSDNSFGLVEYSSSRGNANYMHMQGGTWTCNSETFGDPDPDQTKTCKLINTKETLFDSSYQTLVAVQGKKISTTQFDSTKPVWVGYGKNGKWHATLIFIQDVGYWCDSYMFRNDHETGTMECFLYQSSYVSQSKPVGLWKNVASGQHISQTIAWSTSYTHTTTHTDTLTYSVALAVKEGIVFVDTAVTETCSGASADAVTDSMTHTETLSCMASCNSDKVQYLWQWSVGGIMSTPEQVKTGFRSQTCHYRCTDTAETPRCAFSMTWNENKKQCVDDRNNFLQ